MRLLRNDGNPSVAKMPVLAVFAPGQATKPAPPQALRVFSFLRSAEQAPDSAAYVGNHGIARGRFILLLERFGNFRMFIENVAQSGHARLGRKLAGDADGQSAVVPNGRQRHRVELVAARFRDGFMKGDVFLDALGAAADGQFDLLSAQVDFPA